VKRISIAQVGYTRGKDVSGSLEGACGIGGLLARTDGGQAHVYYCDDPFGKTLASSGPLAEANLYRFSSKEFDVRSGLIYYLYRDAGDSEKPPKLVRCRTAK